MRTLEDAGVVLELLEQPVKAADISGLKYVTDRVNTPVMADESVFSPSQVMDLIQQRAADIINIKLMKTGGLSNAIRIADIAGIYSVPCMIGCMIESSISVAAAVHLAVAKSDVITRSIWTALRWASSTRSAAACISTNRRSASATCRGWALLKCVGWRCWLICALRLAWRTTDVVGRYFSFAKRKVTKETLRRPRADVLRTPVPCAPRSAEDGAELAALRHPRSSPSPELRCSARLKADSTSKATTASVDPRHAWMLLLLLLLYPVSPSRLARSRSVRGRAGGACRGSRHGPEACLGRVGQDAQPRSCRLRRTAQRSKRGQASMDGFTASPANPTRPTHSMTCSTLPTATRSPMLQRTPLGHPACRPC